MHILSIVSALQSNNASRCLLLISCSYQWAEGPFCGHSPSQNLKISVTTGMLCFNRDSYNLSAVASLVKMNPDSLWFRAAVVRAGTTHVPHSTQYNWQLTNRQPLPQQHGSRAGLQLPQPCPACPLEQIFERSVSIQWQQDS